CQQLDGRAVDELSTARRRPDQGRPADRAVGIATVSRPARADETVRGARHARRTQRASAGGSNVGGEPGHGGTSAARLCHRSGTLPRRDFDANRPLAVAALARAGESEPRAGGAEFRRGARQVGAAARSAAVTGRKSAEPTTTTAA